jgi:thymidine phosphorylase
LVVPKLGVPGRSAGGIDVLAQLEGYRINLALRDIEEVLARCGYAHFLADENFAPSDALLFKYRQASGSQDVPALAAASLLAKKIACGVRFAGLDVRVAPHGNFGKTFQEARQSAQLFCAAAAAAGIRAVAILTDARRPYQPYIGRGEALVALKAIFDGRAECLLAEHGDRCRLMAEHVASLAGQRRSGRAIDLGGIFAQNLEAQGSSSAAFEQKVYAIGAEHRRGVLAEQSGFVCLDLAQLREIFVDFNAPPDSGQAFPDEFGIVLRADVGSYAEKGKVLATVRVPDSAWQTVRARLLVALRTRELPDFVPGVEGTIRA